MKHVCIINQSLKMSKGKIARVCLMLGLMTSYLIEREDVIKWIEKGAIGIILKTQDIERIRSELLSKRIKFRTHIDAGLTQVPRDSVCGLAFFLDDKHEELFRTLKLL